MKVEVWSLDKLLHWFILRESRLKTVTCWSDRAPQTGREESTWRCLEEERHGGMRRVRLSIRFAAGASRDRAAILHLLSEQDLCRSPRRGNVFLLA